MNLDALRLGRAKGSTARSFRRLANDSGYATVEFAMTLPLLALAICLGLWLSSLGLAQIQLQSSATTAARILARGEELPTSFTHRLPSGTELEPTFTSEYVAVHLRLDRASPLSKIPMAIELNASAVANLERDQSVIINQE